MIENLSSMDKAIERPRGLSKRALVLIAAGVVALGGVALLVPAVRRWSRADKTVEASRIRVGEVIRGDLVRDAAADGRIVAALHPTLFSPTRGIVSMTVKAGSAVRKGEVLARVESPELRSRLMQERSTLLSLQSSLGRQRIQARQQALKNSQNVALLEVRLQASRRMLERAQRTFDEGLLNKTDFEKAKDDLKIAELELHNARETVRLEAETASFDVRESELSAQRQENAFHELQRQVDQLAIVAPFDGLVASVAVQDRDAVNENQPVVTVVNLSEFEVEITLPENYAADAVPGTPVQILYEGKEYPGKVTAVSPEIRDSQVRGTVVFDGQAPAGLRQSQRVSVRMVFESKRNVLKLPRGPFLESGGGRQVYVIKDGAATQRPVTVGAVSVAEVEVVQGLSVGEKVILSDTSEFAGARNVLVRD